MTTTWLVLEDIPGPKLREALRSSMHRRLPLLVIVDARRTAAPPTLDRLAALLRLRRHARKGGGDLLLVGDEALHRRLHAAGLDTWLSTTSTTAEARSRITSRRGAPNTLVTDDDPRPGAVAAPGAGTTGTCERDRPGRMAKVHGSAGGAARTTIGRRPTPGSEPWT
jgi:hypothetical protein